MLYYCMIVLGCIGYLLGRYHQWSLDDQKPVCFLYKKTDSYPKKIKVYRGEWITIQESENVKGATIPCDDGKNVIVFRDIFEIPEGTGVRINIIKMHKVRNQKYLQRKFKHASEAHLKK